MEKDEADRREPGPGENNLINYYVAVWIEVGNASVGEIVKLPAHEPIPIETAFRAAMMAAMGVPPARHTPDSEVPQYAPDPRFYDV